MLKRNVHHKEILTCVSCFRRWEPDIVSVQFFANPTTIHVLEELVMSPITAETLFTQEMHDTLEHIGTMLKSYFRTLNDPNLETLLLISLGMFLNANNV